MGNLRIWHNPSLKINNWCAYICQCVCFLESVFIYSCVYVSCMYMAPEHISWSNGHVLSLWVWSSVSPVLYCCSFCSGSYLESCLVSFICMSVIYYCSGIFGWFVHLISTMIYLVWNSNLLIISYSCCWVRTFENCVPKHTNNALNTAQFIRYVLFLSTIS
jgi:hypothetical protein